MSRRPHDTTLTLRLRAWAAKQTKEGGRGHAGVDSHTLAPTLDRFAAQARKGRRSRGQP